MKIEDERTSQAFEYVDDGVAFEYDGCIYMKLDREVKGVIDGIVYNAIALDGGNPDTFADDCIVYLVNAEVVVKL